MKHNVAKLLIGALLASSAAFIPSTTADARVPGAGDQFQWTYNICGFFAGEIISCAPSYPPLKPRR